MTNETYCLIAHIGNRRMEYDICDYDTAVAECVACGAKEKAIRIFGADTLSDGSAITLRIFYHGPFDGLVIYANGDASSVSAMRGGAGCK